MERRDLEINVLGELEVRSAGHVQSLPPSRKTRALLGYLAATGRPALRTHLCELLWDGPDDPRAALRWSLNRLRPILNAPGCERLVADRDHVALKLEAVRLDLRAVRSALGAATIAACAPDVLRGAADAFRGEFLEGLELPDCPRFREWCQAERGALRRLRISMLSALVERSVADDDARVGYARARVALEPYDERAHADLMRLLGRLGRTEEALEQYKQCRRLLERELGVKPSPALDIARAEIRASARVAAAHVERKPPVAFEASPPAPIVGRADVLAAMEAHATAAIEAAAPSAVFLSGEPGIGKSRLLGEIATRASNAGRCVLQARAFEVEMVRPYGVWIDAFRRAPGLRLPPELGALLPELGPAPASSQIDRARLLEAARHALLELARHAGSVIILFDDVQWIDDASVALLHLVVRTPAHVAVVCAARAGELEDNAAAMRLIRALRRERRLVKIELGALDEASISELVRALDPTLDPARVYGESGGNPLFAIEIARLLSQGRTGVPETLRGLVVDRVEHLDADVQSALFWAAALGKSFRLDLLAAALGVAAAELATTVEELVRRGFLVTVHRPSGVELDFSHDIVRQSAYLVLSEPRRRAIHERLARALADAAALRSELASDAAHHAFLGGDAELAARWGLAASQRCHLLFANAEAIALADRALRHAATLPRERALGLESALLRVQVCSGAGTLRRRELEEMLMRVAREAQQQGASAAAADALYTLSILHHEGGNFPGAEASILRAAAASRDADVGTKVRSLANAGRCLTQIERDMLQAQAMLSEAEALARQAGLDVLEIDWGLGVIKHFAGEHDAAIVLLERALDGARRARDHFAECECLTRLVMIALERGAFESALERCRPLADLARKMTEGSEGPAADALDALARFALAEPDAADRLDRAIAALREMDAKGLLAYALTFAAEVDIGAGRTTVARARAEEALTAAEALGRRSLTVVARALLGRLLAEAEPARAVMHVEEARRHVMTPLAVSVRARQVLDETAGLLGLSIPTSAPTPAQTDDA